MSHTQAYGERWLPQGIGMFELCIARCSSVGVIVLCVVRSCMQVGWAHMCHSLTHLHTPPSLAHTPPYIKGRRQHFPACLLF